MLLLDCTTAWCGAPLVLDGGLTDREGELAQRLAVQRKRHPRHRRRGGLQGPRR